MKILDISETTDITFKVNWCQNKNYLRVHSESGEYEFPSFNTRPSSRYGASRDYRCNGQLEVTVLNVLTTPQVSSDPIFVNVYTKMCDDFEVAQPSNQFRLRLAGLPTNSLPLDAGTLVTTPDLARGTPPVLVTPPAQPIAPIPNNFIVVTTEPNGLVSPYHGLGTPKNNSPEWSTTIGVAATDKFRQLWAGTGPQPYTLAYGGDGVDTTPIAFVFTNPTATPITITVDFSSSGSSVVTQTLPGAIGPTSL